MKEELERILHQIRRRPQVQITVPGDSGFFQESLMGCCMAQGVDSGLGLARYDRLGRRMEAEMEEARRMWVSTAVGRALMGVFREAWAQLRS